MADEINTEGGAHVDGNADTGGGDFAGRDRKSKEYNPRQQQRNDPSQNMYFNHLDSGQNWVVSEILDHGQQIRELAYRLDNIPAEFSALKGQFETAKNDIRKLQDLEVVVTPEKVLIRPVSGDVTIASHLLIRVLSVALIVVIVGIAILVYWVIAHG